MKLAFFASVLLLGMGPVFGQDILGKWKTIDDNTNEARSVVEIIERSGKIYGKVVMLFPRPGEDPDPVCDKCDAQDQRFKAAVT